MLILRIGQAFYFAGLVRSKNAASSAMRLLLDLAVVALGLWGLGMGFLTISETHPIFDWQNLFSDKAAGALLLMLPIVLVASGSVCGAILERTRIAPLLVFSFLSSVLVALLFKLASELGFVGRGMSIAILFGGAASLVAAKIAGPRKGKYNRDLSVNFIPGHNVTFQFAGVLLFFVGMLNATESELCLVVTTAAAVLTSSLFGKIKFGKIDTGLTLAGTIGGICAGATGIEHAWLGMVIGAIVGVAVPWLLITIEVQLRIDDVAASSATHLVGGLLGILTRIAEVSAMNDHPGFSLARNLIFVVLLIASGVAVSFSIFNTCAKLGKLRVSETAEFDGTDLAELDLNAYPDFQQTMIKSYHLREV